MYGNSHQCNYLNYIKLSKWGRDRGYRSNFWEQLMPVQIIPSQTDFSSATQGYFPTQECHQEKIRGFLKQREKGNPTFPRKHLHILLYHTPGMLYWGKTPKLKTQPRWTQTGKEEPMVSAPIMAPSHCPLPADPRWSTSIHRSLQFFLIPAYSFKCKNWDWLIPRTWDK